MDSADEVVLLSGNSTAGAIRKLILNTNATRKSLLECGYKRMIIDVAKTTVETMDGKEVTLPATVETMDGKEVTLPASSNDNYDQGEKHQFDKIGGRFDLI